MLKLNWVWVMQRYTEVRIPSINQYKTGWVWGWGWGKIKRIRSWHLHWWVIVINLSKNVTEANIIAGQEQELDRCKTGTEQNIGPFLGLVQSRMIPRYICLAKTRHLNPSNIIPIADIRDWYHRWLNSPPRYTQPYYISSLVHGDIRLPYIIWQYYKSISI